MNHTDFSQRAQLIDAERRRLLAALHVLSQSENVAIARASLMSQIAQLNNRCEELRQKFFPRGGITECRLRRSDHLESHRPAPKGVDGAPTPRPH